MSRPLGPRTLEQRGRIAEGRRAELTGGGYDRVLLLVPDPHARFAATELSADFVRDTVLRDGYGACTYLFAWDVERQPVDSPALAPFLGGYGDLLLRPDLASLLPLDHDEVAVVCDAEWPNGAPVDIAPRQILRAQLCAAERLGLVPSIGLEHEVTFRDTRGRPLTEHGIDYALGGTASMAPLLAAIRASTGQLAVESARAECHPGQYEIVLRHRDALGACDDAMLLQHLIRRAAAEHDVQASYLAAEETGQGNSCHVHLSLSELDSESADDGPAQRVSQDHDLDRHRSLGHFLAGVLAAAADLSAIWAPTVNSYVRLRTAPFSPRSVRWGWDDRTAAVRLVGRGGSLRLECRFAGADAQPHLVVAALLAAGLAGVRQELSPPEPGVVVGELAGTPWEALRRLTDARIPRELLGEPVVAAQAALLGAELDSLCETVSDTQRRRGAMRA